MPIRCRRKLRALVQFHGGNYRNRYVLGSEGTQPIEHGLRPSPHQKGHDVCVQEVRRAHEKRSPRCCVTCCGRWKSGACPSASQKDWGNSPPSAGSKTKRSPSRRANSSWTWVGKARSRGRRTAWLLPERKTRTTDVVLMGNLTGASESVDIHNGRIYMSIQGCVKFHQPNQGWPCCTVSTNPTRTVPPHPSTTLRSPRW